MNLHSSGRSRVMILSRFILINLLILSSFALNAQNQLLGNKNNTVEVLGRLKVDTLLINPISNTTTAPQLAGGQIYYNKRIYIWGGDKWRSYIDTAYAPSSGIIRFQKGDDTWDISVGGTETDPLSVHLTDSAAMLANYLRTAGDLSPLFTTTESTQNISFSQSNTSQYTVLGRIASGSGAYSFVPADSALIQGLHSESYYNTKYLTGNQTITLSGDVSGSGTTAITTAIGSNKVTDAMLRQSAGLSVIGRSLNTTGNVADITGADHQVLRVSGTTLGFGSIDSSYVTGLHSENYYNTKYLMGSHDSDAYHTMTSLSDSTVRVNRPNGTGDTLLLAIGVSMDSLWRTPGVDSIKFSIDGRYHAIKDSTASGAALNATQIGFGSGSNLLTGIDSLTYSAANRLITTTNSQAGATFTANSSTTIQGLNALILQNTSPATVSITGLSSPLVVFGANGWKSNSTAGSWQSWWALGSVATSGASGLNSSLQFYAGSGLALTPSGLTWRASLDETGLFTASGNLRAGGTSGNGTVFASSFDASTTSGTSISINASNSSNSTITAKFASQEVIKFFQATRNVSFQNGGTIPADAADGGQFNIYQLSGMTGIGSVTGTGGTPNLAAGGTTNFINQVQPGDQIAIAIPNAETLTVLSVTDATHLVFTTNMANSHTNAAYTIIPATTRKFTVYNNGNSLQNGKSMYANTITAGGTTGNRTIDKPTGTVNIAAGGTTVTVTNSLCTASSIVFAVIRTNDATAQIKSVVPAAGSFTINIVASTGEVSIGWIVYN